MAVAAVVMVCGLIGTAGCSSGTNPDSPTGSASVVTTNNQQDAIFASQLIELSEQLVTITDILDAKTDDPAVAAKMDDLSRTANERIVLAKSWLRLWGRTGVQAPPTPGLLTEQQQDALIDSTGAKLTAAIASATQSQVEGTLAVSQAETQGGENSAAIQVAQQLAIKAQAELAVLARVRTPE